MKAQAKTGKLSADTLARLLRRYASRQDPSVLVGPRVGIDAAALRVGRGILVVASDPITYAAEDVGRLAVFVNANDIFVCGAEPRWFLADILLPPGQDRLADVIFRDLHRACKELGVCLIGGHTELTPDLPRPMVAGCMIGQAAGGRVLTAAGSQPGDAILLTKAVAIEGTAVLAREHAKELSRQLPPRLLQRAQGFLRNPGINVGPEARIASRHGAHAMHDPTEGGVLGGLWEMSCCSGLAFRVQADRIPVYPETRAVCQYFGLDPLGLLASGSLLVTCPPRAAARMIRALQAQGAAACEIGRTERGRPGVYLDEGQVVRGPVTDEILKVGPSAGSIRSVAPPARSRRHSSPKTATRGEA